MIGLYPGILIVYGKIRPGRIACIGRIYDSRLISLIRKQHRQHGQSLILLFTKSHISPRIDRYGRVLISAVKGSRGKIRMHPEGYSIRVIGKAGEFLLKLRSLSH